jgi:FkbM family methyltransferase
MTRNGEQLLQRQVLDRFTASNERLVMFDVGANVGDWTLSALREASTRRMEKRLEIHAFEPVPATFRVLQDRIGRSPMAQAVRAVASAMSSRTGTAEMHVGGETAGTNSLHPDGMNPDGARVRIDTITALDYCSGNGVGTVHVLKCDTEGHDLDVLVGAKRLFDDERIVICQFEYNHRWIYSRHYLKDVFDLFQGGPYRVGKVTPTGVELYGGWHPELERFFEGNYVLLHPEGVRWLTTRTGRFDESNVYRVTGMA